MKDWKKNLKIVKNNERNKVGGSPFEDGSKFKFKKIKLWGQWDFPSCFVPLSKAKGMVIR
jgi:hypothetical protein